MGNHTRIMPRGVIALIALIAVAALPATPAFAAHRKAPRTRSVLYVGNNWEGTADVVQPRKVKGMARIDSIPDVDERVREIQSDGGAYGYFLGIRQAVGEG